jgi:hypothetical protein
MSEQHFYEILVPMNWNNDGSKIDVEYHRQWDAKVRAISGGLTILRAVRGQWQYEDKLFTEKVIPCRILATREQMDKIVDITLEHYHDQISVLAYRLSSEVIMKYREGHEHGCS